MLKTLPGISTKSYLNAKCAEIFCQSSTNFTIICTFCKMKSFEFDDFLLHFRNVHFENNLWKTEQVLLECTPYLEINIKNEVNKIEDESASTADRTTDRTQICGNASSTSSVNDDAGDDEWNDDAGDDDAGDDEWNDDVGDDDDEWNDDKEDYKPKKRGRPSADDHKKFQCEQCKKHYKTAGVLRHHMKKYHSEEKLSGKYQCSECPEVLSNVRQLNSHMINKHRGFPCSHCDKTCRSSNELKRHEVTHTGVKNFVCDFENCGKRFFTRRRLTVHRHIHADPKNFVCETCGYSCRIKAMLNVHYRSHTGEKPYACNICNKRFASSSMLSEHKPIHSTERPHICDVCGAAFSRPKALYHHKHLHLSVKKFKCKLCGNAYAQAAGLAGHMRQHKQSTILLS